MPAQMGQVVVLTNTSRPSERRRLALGNRLVGPVNVNARGYKLEHRTLTNTTYGVSMTKGSAATATETAEATARRERTFFMNMA